VYHITVLIKTVCHLFSHQTTNQKFYLSNDQK
jgi:hypothetical protein